MWNKELEERGIDGWMERGRTATADGGEDPLLTNTLIIHIQKKAGTKADRMMLKPQQHSTCSSLSETWSAPQKGKMRVFLYKTWIEVVLFFSTTSHFIWSKKKPPTYFPAGIRILFPPMSRLHIFPYPHTLLLCIPLSTSPSFFLDHRQWCLVNITLIHSSFKCRHYGYQMHLWLFRPIDWHNQYVILGKFALH